VVYARNLVKSELLIVSKAQIGDALIDGDKLDLGPNGELSALTANLGTMTTGMLGVGAGGVVIGDTTTGVSISGNVIRCIKSGVTTVQIDGATGFLTCTKVIMTTDSTSSVNLNAGTNYIGTSVTIGPAGTDRIVNDLARTFFQDAEPTQWMSEGDLWFDTNAGNKAYRYSGTAWVLAQDTSIASAYTLASGKVVTFAQGTVPTALAIGDIWIDTAHGNKIYRATSTGTGGWVLAADERLVSRKPATWT
jgi:hypothetical protein